MEDGLPVRKGVEVDVLEEEGDWCWCGYTGKVLRMFVGLMCRRDTSPRTSCERCESLIQSISPSIDEKEAEDQRPFYGRVSYIDLQVDIRFECEV